MLFLSRDVEFKRFTLYSSSFAYTTFLIQLFFPNKLPQFITEIVRGSAMLVAFSVLTIYIVYTPQTIVKFYRENTFVKNVYAINKSNKLIFITDLFIHFVPVLLLGLPKTVEGVFTAMCLMLSWYVLFRDEMHRLYIKEIKDYDHIILVTVLFSIVYMIVLVRT